MNLRIKTVLCIGAAGLFCLLLANAANADSFDWTYQGTMLNVTPGILDSGSGELTTTNGVITGITGVFNGLAITALLPPGAFVGNDNLLVLPANPLVLTQGGVSFVDSAGTQYNIYAVLGTECTCGPSGCDCVPDDVYGSISDTGLNNDIGNFVLTPIAPTPEPATITMLLVAMLLLGRKGLVTRRGRPSSLFYKLT